MKRSRLVLLLTGGAIAFVIVCLSVSSRDSQSLAVRLVGRTNDAAGVLHIVCEITNMQRRPVNFALRALETRTESGWHRASNHRAQPRSSATYLLGRSATNIAIVAPPEGEAVRGWLMYARVDGAIKSGIVRLFRAVGLADPFVSGPMTRSGAVKIPEMDK